MDKRIIAYFVDNDMFTQDEINENEEQIKGMLFYKLLESQLTLKDAIDTMKSEIVKRVMK